MDGFISNKGVIVIAATNRKETLDPALIRPGRFDRLIQIPLPDRISRLEILDLYLENKITEGINLSLLAELTAGFSGAQIKNLINEAAINAARVGNNFITQKNIEDALEKLIIGIVKKTDERDIEVKKRIAIHELGHAFITATFSEYFDLTKVSIQSTYNGIGGFTLLNEKSNIIEGGLYTKDLIKKRLIISLGGKAAENLFYGEENVSIGSMQDLKEANALARRMIYNYGFGNSNLEVFYGDIYNSPNYSDFTQHNIDNEILSLINDAYSEALNIIKKNKDIIKSLTDELIINKFLSGEIIYNKINLDKC
jgi:cell division protease FtsH